jgi:hypothetical protein
MEYKDQFSKRLVPEGLTTKDAADIAYNYLNKRNGSKHELGWVCTCGVMFLLGLIAGAFAVMI